VEINLRSFTVRNPNQSEAPDGLKSCSIGVMPEPETIVVWVNLVFKCEPPIFPHYTSDLLPRMDRYAGFYVYDVPSDRIPFVGQVFGTTLVVFRLKKKMVCSSPFVNNP